MCLPACLPACLCSGFSPLEGFMNQADYNSGKGERWYHSALH